jgi:hypothetical protein
MNSYEVDVSASRVIADMLGSIGAPEILIIFGICAFVALVAVLPFWMIFCKAGFSGWLSLTQLVPLVNIVVLFYVACAEWPIQRQLRDRPHLE